MDRNIMDCEKHLELNINGIDLHRNHDAALIESLRDSGIDVNCRADHDAVVTALQFHADSRCRIDIDQDEEAGEWTAEQSYEVRRMMWKDYGVYPSWRLNPITTSGLVELLTHLVNAGHGDREVRIWPEIVKAEDGLYLGGFVEKTAADALAAPRT